jgi:hypothetical protein
MESLLYLEKCFGAHDELSRARKLSSGWRRLQSESSHCPRMQKKSRRACGFLHGQGALG